MIKLTTLHGGSALVLNPSQIQSAKNLSRAHGAEIVMATGARHEVEESAEKIFDMIEELRQ